VGVCSTGCALRLVRCTRRGPELFTRGRAERHRSGACPQQARHPRPRPYPLWEGRSTAHALDLERANAAPDRSAEVTTSVAAPLVTTGRSPREVPSIRGGRPSAAKGPVGRPPQLGAALDGGSALNLGSAPWPG
jgi:hypothetical protein